jgi:hypothetical protein
MACAGKAERISEARSMHPEVRAAWARRPFGTIIIF